MTNPIKLSIIAFLAAISLLLAPAANALTVEECQAKYVVLQSRVAQLEAVIQQAFASKSRYRFSIQKLRSQQITELKNQFVGECPAFVAP